MNPSDLNFKPAVRDHFFTDGTSSGTSGAAQIATLGLPIAFLLTAIAMGLYYAKTNASPGESGLAAINLLKTGIIGNPYPFPTGPTAHVSPVLVMYLAGVFAAFGPNSASARIVLSILAATCYAVSSFLTLRICAKHRRVFWCVCALMLIFPIFLFWNSVYERQWDQPFSSLVIIGAWALLTVRPSSDPRPLLGMAVLSGFGILLAPGLIPSLVCAAVAMAWRQRAYFRLTMSIPIVAVAIIWFLLPWGVRNELTFGKFIITRSNFPLEFVNGNGNGADGLVDSGDGINYHPYYSKTAAEEMARVGEVRYMEEMVAVAKQEISSRPIDFLKVTANRVIYTIIPPPRMLSWEPPFGHFAGYFATVLGLFHALALLVSLPFKRARFFSIVFTVLPITPYWITEVNMRYLAVTYFPTLIIVSWCVVELENRVRMRLTSRSAVLFR